MLEKIFNTMSKNQCHVLNPDEFNKDKTYGYTLDGFPLDKKNGYVNKP